MLFRSQYYMKLYKITIDSQTSYRTYANSEQEALEKFGLVQGNVKYEKIEVIIAQIDRCPNGNCEE